VQQKYLITVKSAAYIGMQKSIRGAMCTGLHFHSKIVEKVAPESADLAI
jgi:hypothetical protein